MPTIAQRRTVAGWLFLCCFLVFATLVVGGVTRLTHSGLSIVEWKPLVGAIPPLSHVDWQQLFDLYRQSPEFQKVNAEMDLAGFQFIFWWEWTHRLLGRLVGMVFLLPFLFFWRRGWLCRGEPLRMAGFLLLGGLQGAMGWYMVKSGLVDDPRVSQYRLAAHLGLAFLIFGLMAWTALGILQSRPSSPLPATARLRTGAAALLALVFIMALSGALVAGTHAGALYPTFPLMGDRWIPAELFGMVPAWKAPFEHQSTIQFDHRLIAWSLLFLVPSLCVAVFRQLPAARPAALMVLAMLATQISLGIATLLTGVPLALAASHQAGAMVLFGLMVWLNHAIRRA